MGRTGGVLSPGFDLTVFWFTPSGVESRTESVGSIPALRRSLAPFEGHGQLVVGLHFDHGAAGSVWMHRSGDRAWVTYRDDPNAEEMHSRNPVDCRPDEVVRFRFTDGLEDDVCRHWTVSVADGVRAVEHFLQHGGRDPAIGWSADREPPPGQPENPPDPAGGVRPASSPPRP